MPVSIPSDHRSHDLSLIAGDAADDLSPFERGRAEALMASCDACAGLRRDLVAITAATRALPAPAAPTRDFRLTAEQADRLRRGSWLRRILAPFGPSRSAVRPLAAAFTSLGLAGLFVVTVLPGFLGSAASMAAPSQERDYVTAAGTTAPGLPAAQGAGAPSGAPALHSSGGPEPAATNPDTAVKAEDGRSPAPQPPVAGGYFGGVATERPVDQAANVPAERASAMAIDPLVAGSLVLLGIGLLLFGLRFAARRLR